MVKEIPRERQKILHAKKKHIVKYLLTQNYYRYKKNASSTKKALDSLILKL